MKFHIETKHRIEGAYWKTEGTVLVVGEDDVERAREDAVAFAQARWPALDVWAQKAPEWSPHVDWMVNAAAAA